MITQCLRCRVSRMRVIAKTFHLFGESVDQLKVRFAKSNPDIEFRVYVITSNVSVKHELVASKDGWHFSIIEEKAKVTT